MHNQNLWYIWHCKNCENFLMLTILLLVWALSVYLDLFFVWMLTKIIMKRFISGKGHMWQCRNILNKILKCLYNFCHTMATQVKQSNGSPDLFKGYNSKQIDSTDINKIKALKFD